MNPSFVEFQDRFVATVDGSVLVRKSGTVAWFVTGDDRAAGKVVAGMAKGRLGRGPALTKAGALPKAAQNLETAVVDPETVDFAEFKTAKAPAKAGVKAPEKGKGKAAAKKPEPQADDDQFEALAQRLAARVLDIVAGN